MFYREKIEQRITQVLDAPGELITTLINTLEDWRKGGQHMGGPGGDFSNEIEAVRKNQKEIQKRKS